MNRRLLHKNFCASAPNKNKTINFLFTFKASNIRDDLFRELTLVFGSLNVRSVKLLDVMLVKDCRPRRDRLKLWLNMLQQFRLKYLGVTCCLIAVIFKYVPPAKN